MSLYKGSTLLVGSLLVAVFCGGCASLFSRRQNLKVISDPPGAKVYQEGELVGETPGFVEVLRRKDSELVYVFPNTSKKTVPLTSSYRWGDSFATNLSMALIPVASVTGFGIDFYTGAAWNFDAIPPVGRGDGIPKLQENPVRKIAIAPPRSNALASSKQVGRNLEKRLQVLFPNAEVIPFEKTEATFARYSWDFDQKTESDVLEDLYKDLGATHLVEAEVVEPIGNAGVLTHMSMVDVFSGNRKTLSDHEFSRKEVTYFDSNFFVQGFDWLIARAPNNFGLNFTTNTTTIVGANYDGYYSEEFKADGLTSLLRGISLRRIDGRDGIKKWSLRSAWVPSVTVSQRDFKFFRTVANNRIADKRFTWTSIYAGLGPQLTLHMPVGRIYLEAIPSFGLSYITWRNNSDFWDLHGVFGVQAEIGYLLFLSERFNMRLFTSVTTSDSGQWESVLTKATGENQRLSTSSYSVAGLSIAYYFPELSHAGINWFE